MNFRTPARHIAKRGRADETQTLHVHQLCAPASTRAFLIETGRECTKTECKFVLAGQRNGQILAEKHAVRLQQQFAVEKDVAYRGKPAKMERGGTGCLLDIEEI